MTKMRIAVYCSASDELPEHWREDARTLGRWIGLSGAELIFGGVGCGLMKIVSEAARSAGARTVGVVPARRLDMAAPHMSVAIRTSDLSERKRIILNLADAFVALPGGYGTLDEVASTVAHLCFTGRQAPIVLCNTDDIFTPLVEQYRTFAEKGLMRGTSLENLHVTDNIGEAISVLENLNSTLLQ